MVSYIDYYFVAPCRLPHFKNGQYLSGYRGGLTIAHGAKIQYQCEPDFTRSPQSSINCSNGELLPAPPSCRSKGSVANFAQTGAGITRTVGDLAAIGAGKEIFISLKIIDNRILSRREILHCLRHMRPF